MKTGVLAVFVPFIAFILGMGFQGKKPQVPFINSTGWTINSIPYSTRVYWMKQANQALFNYSGPWSSRAYSNLIVVLRGRSGQ